MGQTPTDTVSSRVDQIAQTRRRLDAELEELETYLPPTRAFMKRMLGAAVGAWAGVMLLAFFVRKRSERRAARRLRSIDERLERLERRLDR